MIRFILNNQLIETGHATGGTVLDFVRYHKRLAGTKIGCREGDCGACTILVGDLEAEGKLVYRSMTSCLMPLGNVNGKHIVSVEGINMKELSPVQQAIVDTNGTQCGFCTIGFVMSLTGFVMNQTAKGYDEAIASIDGNICRCTGYKSIERAAGILSEKMTGKPEERTIEWLAEQKFIPSYFLQIRERLQQLRKRDDENISVPGEKMVLGGGTDLVVQRSLAVKRSVVQHLFDEGGLKGIYIENNQYHVGASVTVTAFAESEMIQQIFPELKRYIRLISSTPVRNMATMAGNLVNASPIGDMSVFFLALNSDLVLNKDGVRRRIKLKDFFKGYKETDRSAGEIIEKIIFDPPQKGSFSFEKVCKRTHLDIASVNSACQMRLAEDGTIADIYLSAGGVAPIPKYLVNTSAFLKGRMINEATMAKAITVMNDEIAPISDARGTSDYKRLLLRQLFLAHFLSFDKQSVAVIKNILQP